MFEVLSLQMVYVHRLIFLAVLKTESFKLFLIFCSDLDGLFNWNVKQLFVYLAAEYTTPNNVLISLVSSYMQYCSYCLEPSPPLDI